MMKKTLTLVMTLFVSSMAYADFTPWADYEPSEEVWSVTTIKVDSNMGDAYLEGIANTWVPGNEASKKVGQIEDYWIYRSDMPDSGDFNLLLVVKFANTDALAPTKARYDAFMKEFTQRRADEATEFAQKNYPAMREITGQYIMREIELK
ncbi:MAG: hypothetical protein AAF438_08405 [Pseudomonadota bacterium]